MRRLSFFGGLSLLLCAGPALFAACRSDGAPGPESSSNFTGAVTGSAGSGSGGATSTSTTVTSSPSASSGSGGASGSGCTVASQGTAGVVLRGTILAGAGVSQGEVFVDTTGLIACAGASCASTTGYADATVIACTDGVISPGLINAHDHTEYDTAAPIAHGTTRWDHRDGWRTGAGGEMKLSEPQTTSDPKMLAAAELRFVLGGATSVIGSGGVHGLLRNLAAYPDTTMTEGLAGITVFFDTFPLGDQNGTELTSGCAYPKVRSTGTAFFGGEAYAAHVSEGVNAAAENEFSCVSGSLGLLNSQTAIIHGVGLNATDIAKIAAAGAKLIWSPRSNISLYGNTATIPAYKALGVTIALGTDWLASGSMNMLREAQCADTLNKTAFNGALSDAELWAAMTTNAAVAAKYDAEIGDLKKGLKGDVAVFGGATGSYRDILDAGVEDVRLVLRGGKALYGDAALVAALDPTCSALDVCGVSKSVCVDAPSVTFADVQTAASASYPLFFCKGTTPTDEPSCVPYRSEYANGITATDEDGDGIADASDDCPAVFNPVRPMDGTTQADVDGDMAGDACDKKPTDATAQ